MDNYWVGAFNRVAAHTSARTLIWQLNAAKLSPPLSLACVQTAYANGASGGYIRSLGVEVPLAKTGVKFLHHL